MGMNCPGNNPQRLGGASVRQYCDAPWGPAFGGGQQRPRSTTTGRCFCANCPPPTHSRPTTAIWGVGSGRVGLCAHRGCCNCIAWCSGEMLPYCGNLAAQRLRLSPVAGAFSLPVYDQTNSKWVLLTQTNQHNSRNHFNPTRPPQLLLRVGAWIWR